MAIGRETQWQYKRNFDNALLRPSLREMGCGRIVCEPTGGLKNVRPPSRRQPLPGAAPGRGRDMETGAYWRDTFAKYSPRTREPVFAVAVQQQFTQGGGANIYRSRAVQTKPAVSNLPLSFWHEPKASCGIEAGRLPEVPLDVGEGEVSAGLAGIDDHAGTGQGFLDHFKPHPFLRHLR